VRGEPGGEFVLCEVAGGDLVLAFVEVHISRDTDLNLIDQYHPCYRGEEYPEPNWPITSAEFRAAVLLAREHGLWRLDQR